MELTRNRNSFFNPESVLLGLALVLFIAAGIIHQKHKKPIVQLSKQDSALNIDKDILVFMSAGNKRMLADLLWIQTLLESDLEKYSGRDLNSWMYVRFLSIAFLDKYFYENYLYGGLYLSIIKDDLEGAADIFEKGLLLYPDDYKLNYHAGFNYYFEMGELEKGFEKLEKIKNSPELAPGVKFIIEKLRFETTQNYDLTLEYLINSYENTHDEILRNKLASDIYALKAERDLKCLNTNEQNCDHLDAEGIPYRFNGKEWNASREFVPYKIHFKQK